jgi:basic membrane lipoprotein Med (substrate-binding protein (PBP1-ABC) superfamily)
MLRFLSFAFALLLFAAGGCTRPGSEGNAGEEFRVALISPGPVNDNGWNASAYEGLLRIEKELGAVKSQQQIGEAGIADSLRRNAERGAKLVIGHGFEFGAHALAVAKDFPKSVFVVSAGAPGVEAANVASMVWRVEDAAYLCGRIAAAISKTGMAGCVGGMDIPPVRSAFDAFTEGAKSANPQFQVRPTYIGNWHDIGTAKAQSKALIDAGCDTLFHDADAAGLGVLQAATEKGIFAFGCTKDQSESAPKAVLASAVTDVPSSFVAIAKEVKSGTFRGRRIEWTRKDGIVKLVWNPALKDRVPESVRKEIEVLDAKIASGALKVTYTSP